MKKAVLLRLAYSIISVVACVGAIDCSAQDDAIPTIPTMYNYKPARGPLFRDDLAFQRALIQKLLMSINPHTTLSDIEALTEQHFIEQVADEDYLDDHRRFSSYIYDYPGGYRIEFQILKSIPGSSVASDGFRVVVFVPDMRGIDVSECLSLADIGYFANHTGWSEIQPLHPSRIELHGFAMTKEGLRFQALARGNVVDRHFLAVGGAPAEKGPYAEEYISQVYTFQGCLDAPGGNALIIESNVGLAQTLP